MKTKAVALATAATLLVAGITATVYAAAQTYKYKCSKCGLIQEYAQPGIYKCPKDGSAMFSTQ